MSRRASSRWFVGVLTSGLAILAIGAHPALPAAVTDSANRTVEVPADVRAVIPAGPPAQVLIHALAPERLAGLVEPFGADDAIYVDPKIAALPRIPMLSRSSAPEDIASVAGVKPGLVVDYGAVSARFVATTQKTQAALRVPALLFDGSLEGTAQAVRTLGSALHVDARAGVLAGLAADVLRQAKPVSDLPDDKRVAVYLARGADGLTAARAGTSFDEPLRLAGGKNVVGGDGPTFKRMSVEEVVALKPAVVILATTEALSSPLRKALPKDTKVVLDAGEPYRVLTGPPSINRLIGLVALAALLHPDKVAADRDEVARMETTLFPIPPGLAVPAPLQVRE